MKVFTTGQVAKICKVAPRTVSRWFDSGRLRGYRIPGSQDRRIPREYLIKFLKEHGMPLGEQLVDDATFKVLIVSQDQALIDGLRQKLPQEEFFEVVAVGDAFDAGFETHSLRPDCVIVDLAIGRAEALQICQRLRRNREHGQTVLIALMPDDNEFPSSNGSGADEVFPKPINAAFLADRVRVLV